MLRRKMFLLSIFVVGILAISAVSAAENATNDIVSDDNENYNAQIIAEDMREEYDTWGNNILFRIEDLDGNPIEDAEPTVTYDNKKIRAGWDSEQEYSDNPGTYVLDVDPDAGSHNVKIELNTTKYQAKSAFMNVEITKIPIQLTLKKYVTTTKEYAVLKATVKDAYGDKLYDGKVKFKVNGKTYSVDVENGVATKKIKLPKAKTYTYTATFTSKNYKTKTASSKLYIKKAKSYYTLKITNPKIHKTFKVKLSYKKYLKILNAKNKGKYGSVDVFTGIKRPEEYGGGYYSVGLSTKDEYFTYHGYELGDYIYLYGGGGYLCLKKVNLYTANF